MTENTSLDLFQETTDDALENIVNGKFEFWVPKPNQYTKENLDKWAQQFPNQYEEYPEKLMCTLTKAEPWFLTNVGPNHINTAITAANNAGIPIEICSATFDCNGKRLPHLVAVMIVDNVPRGRAKEMKAQWSKHLQKLLDWSNR